MAICGMGIPTAYRFTAAVRCTALLAVLTVIAAGTGNLRACQVPVFRYALERWSADAYTVVFKPGTSGELSGEEQQAFDFLKDVSLHEEFPVNLQVRLAEVTGEKPVSEQATMELIYPQKIRGFVQSPIWTGPATLESAKRIVDSPARRKAVEAILSGKSAVWLIVKSGDESLDRPAIEEMQKVAIEAGEVLRIPEGVIQQSDLDANVTPTGAPIDPENILQSRVPLKIDFGVITVSRDDPAESVFLEMLLNLEDDLGEFAGEPMVFPVFGRGRVLEPLIGRGVTKVNALDYAGYLCGACSCEVKDQNPGMDLLVTANWEVALEGSQIILEKILPPLEGLTGLTAMQVPAGIEAPAGTAEPASSSENTDDVTNLIASSGPTVENSSLISFSGLWLAVGGVFVLLVVGSFVILRKKTS